VHVDAAAAGGVDDAEKAIGELGPLAFKPLKSARGPCSQKGTCLGDGA
jgi:hypothetical protein